MRPLTLFSLIGAMVLALITLPLLFIFLPVALGCGTASLLLVLLALPDLVATDQQDDAPDWEVLSSRSA